MNSKYISLLQISQEWNKQSTLALLNIWALPSACCLFPGPLLTLLPSLPPHLCLNAFVLDAFENFLSALYHSKSTINFNPELQLHFKLIISWLF